MQRPDLADGLTSAEFLRWYWTVAELRPFARRLGVSASGTKAEVTERIAQALPGGQAATKGAGEEVGPTAGTGEEFGATKGADGSAAGELPGAASTRRPRPRRTRLRPPFDSSTPIPAGLVLSRELRDWFVAELGPGFHADHHLREFLRDGGGHTLGDAVRLWRDTRDAPAPPIGAQFELNAFSRRWHSAHPGGSRADMLAAWREHRDLPREERERAAGSG